MKDFDIGHDRVFYTAGPHTPQAPNCEVSLSRVPVKQDQQIAAPREGYVLLGFVWPYIECGKNRQAGKEAFQESYSWSAPLKFSAFFCYELVAYLYIETCILSWHGRN